MSQAKLQAAKELIQEKNYQVARAVLRTIPNDSTAQKWLAKLDRIAPEVTEIADPFEDNSAYRSFLDVPTIPPPPPLPQQMGTSQYQPYPQPVRYEYKTVTVQAAIWDSLDKKVDQKIREMSTRGWEYVGQHDQANMGILGPKGNGSRVLQFRRPQGNF